MRMTLNGHVIFRCCRRKKARRKKEMARFLIALPRCWYIIMVCIHRAGKADRGIYHIKELYRKVFFSIRDFYDFISEKKFLRLFDDGLATMVYMRLHDCSHSHLLLQVYGWLVSARPSSDTNSHRNNRYFYSSSSSSHFSQNDGNNNACRAKEEWKKKRKRGTHTHTLSSVQSSVVDFGTVKLWLKWKHVIR